MKNVVMEQYPNCKYPVIAMYYVLNDWSTKTKKSRICDTLNITERLLDEILDGKESLEAEEIYKYKDYDFALGSHLTFHKSEYSYLTSKTIPYYKINNRKHRRKINMVKSEYMKVIQESLNMGKNFTLSETPNFNPLPFYDGIVLRHEIDIALSTIKFIKRNIQYELKNKTKPMPRDIRGVA